MELKFKSIFIQFRRDKILYVHSEIKSNIEFLTSRKYRKQDVWALESQQYFQRSYRQPPPPIINTLITTLCFSSCTISTFILIHNYTYTNLNSAFP